MKTKTEITKDELGDLVKVYFTEGRGTIKVCPTRYAEGYYQSTLISTSKAK